MRVLIVEDEIMAQNSLIRVLSQNFPDLDVVGTTTSVKGAVSWLKDPENSADIIFMDVELSDGVCFEIFRQVEVKSKVIMTTAYDSYALKAFEAGSIDYLLKPIEITDLKRAGASSTTRHLPRHWEWEQQRKTIRKNTLYVSMTASYLSRHQTSHSYTQKRRIII